MDTFGFWRVLKKHTSKHWLCQCDCGARRLVVAATLRNGTSKSCGCKRSNLISRNRRTHGLSQLPEYHAWADMKRRCLNPSHKHFNRYGGRGIAICDRWLSGDGTNSALECFIGDMGLRPSNKYSLDRANNDKGYTPDNCRWSTKATQAANRKVCKLHLYKESEATAAEHARNNGLTRTLVENRLSLGWTITEAIEMPRFARSIRETWKRVSCS